MEIAQFGGSQRRIYPPKPTKPALLRLQTAFRPDMLEFNETAVATLMNLLEHRRQVRLANRRLRPAGMVGDLHNLNKIEGAFKISEQIVGPRFAKRAANIGAALCPSPCRGRPGIANVKRAERQL
jgi:hypothetical protein